MCGGSIVFLHTVHKPADASVAYDRTRLGVPEQSPHCSHSKLLSSDSMLTGQAMLAGTMTTQLCSYCTSARWQHYYSSSSASRNSTILLPKVP